jgi:hypothetical protein
MIKNEDGQRTKEVLPLLSSLVGMAEWFKTIPGWCFFVLGTKKIVKVVGGKIKIYFCIKSCPVKVLSYHRGGEANRPT